MLKKASIFQNWRITYGIFKDFAFKDEVLKNGVFDDGLYQKGVFNMASSEYTLIYFFVVEFAPIILNQNVNNVTTMVKFSYH